MISEYFLFVFFCFFLIFCFDFFGGVPVAVPQFDSSLDAIEGIVTGSCVCGESGDPLCARHRAQHTVFASGEDLNFVGAAHAAQSAGVHVSVHSTQDS